MTDDLQGLERVAASMHDGIREYARDVRDYAGDSAKSLTLFGAIVAGSFDPGRSVVRSVLVVDVINLTMLRRLGEQGARFGEAGIAAPLIMTPAYIKASLDTFPLEFIEIRQQHVTLFGEEYFDELSFDDAHVRLQVERELKVTLIGLRQGLLAAAGRETFIGALEMDVAEGLMRTLRGLLWLKGGRDARPASEVLTEIEKIAGRSLVGVRTALDCSAHHGWNEFEGLYKDVEALGEFADAL